MGNKITQEEFMRRVYNNNEQVRNGTIELLDEFKGLAKRMRYICHKCNTIHNPIAQSLAIGNGCSTCRNNKRSETQRKSHQDFVDEIKQISGNITIIGTYTTLKNKVECMCEFGHKWFALPSSLLRGAGCPYCSNKKVLVGFNDIATTSPDIFMYLANPENGYKYTRWSNTRVDFRCPLCGHIQNRKIASVAHRGFSCECCSDTMSYPNKFGRAFFDQLPLNEYKTEYNPKWAQSYVYDIYFKLNEQEYLVELDGLQHVRGGFSVPLEEISKTDKEKDYLAKENNVRLIRIDCKKSDMDYIKDNIKHSELGSLFDCEEIDWNLCAQRAQSNWVKIVCDLWMSGMRSFEELSKTLHIGNSTVREYINQGVKLGWCDYNSDEWRVKQCHPVCVTNTIDGREYFFESLKMCEQNSFDILGIKIAAETIKKYCENSLAYKGFFFKYDNNNTKLIKLKEGYNG